MGILSADTSREAEEVQFDILRARGLTGRFQLLTQAIQESWSLVVAGGCETALERWLGQPCPVKKEGRLVAMQPLSTPLLLAEALDALDVPYVVGGSYASSIHGEPRSTRGCDFLVALGFEHHEPLARALEGEFYLSRSAMEEAQRLRRCFNLIHSESGFKLDVFVSKGRPFDQERLQRGLKIEFGTRSLRFSSAEDTVLAKLEWHSISPGEQQWRDIVGILLLQRDRLDRGYLKFWARELGVADSLQLALNALD